MENSLSLEEKLLLAALKGNVPAVPENINWAEFLKLSRKARVSPFVYYQWKKVNFPFCPPPEIFDAFEKDFYETFSRNILIQKLTKKVFNRIKKNIEIIPLKGVVFMEKFYPHLGTRPLSDIDFLIKSDDYEKLKKILNDSQGKLLVRKPYAAVFTLSNPIKINFDVAWNFLAIERFIKTCNWSDEEVWRRAKKTEVCEENILLLSPEDTLLHLIYHQAFQHCFRNFLGYLDITRLINQTSIDWEFFHRVIIRLGLASVAKKELKFCKDYLGANVPLKVISNLKENLWNQIVFRGFSELAPENLHLSCPDLVDWLRQPFFWDRFSQIGKTFFYALFPSKNWMRAKLRKFTP